MMYIFLSKVFLAEISLLFEVSQISFGWGNLSLIGGQTVCHEVVMHRYVLFDVMGILLWRRADEGWLRQVVFVFIRRGVLSKAV
jgi:hypothetical protein